jgi:dTDP-glucose 4,6-dehydratase
METTKSKKILVTGGCGFVGGHLIEHLLKNTDWQITTLDRFDAAGNPNRLADILDNTSGIDRTRVKFVFWDLKAELNEQIIKQLDGPFDYIAHLAAGSHVDRSIEDPMSFFMDNTIGTVNLLEYARHGGLYYGHDVHVNEGKIFQPKFLYFSTDEVYGPAPFDMVEGYSEWDRQNPNNPYAAAKAAAEMAVISYANTYRIPSVITNCENIIGQRQDAEKYLPLVINKVLKGEKLLVHANKEKTQAGKRFYLHARNISAATIWILQNGKVLDGSATQGRYNVVSPVEMDNLDFAKLITKYVNEWLVKKGEQAKELDYELVSWHSSRPGHDLRYALNGDLLISEGFIYPVDFDTSLKSTIDWTLDHGDKWL